MNESYFEEKKIKHQVGFQPYDPNALLTVIVINIPVDQTKSKTLSFLEKPLNHLYNRLKNTQYITSYLYSSGKIRHVPATMRGNKVYAWYQARRMEQIQTAIDADKLIKNDSTNVFFITLTNKYDSKNWESIKESWLFVPKEYTKFMRKLKKSMSIKHHIGVFEAHEGGGCHAHIVLVLPEMVKCWVDKEGVLRSPEDLNALIKKLWGQNVDVRGARNSGIAGYLTKELGKTNHVEDAIKRAKKGEETPSDRKKIWAYYWADKLNIRLLRVSHSLPSASEMEDVETEEIDPERLDNNSINSTEPEDKIIKVLTFPRSVFRKWDWFFPWTGEVPRDSEEYQKLIELFDLTTPKS